ncbi:MAG: DUF2971 domain-containing protein [Deltaproteobacteria bacterium]|nr:MAG: DUF2971 domain-containing protein [Deltaproteobacteria bacterium]
MEAILKFRKIDKFLIDSLVHSQIFFASPEDLNDPFDCNVDIEKSLKKAISESSGSDRQILQQLLNDEVRNEFSKVHQQVKKEWGVFSACGKPEALNCSLLWSHYADGHRGICLIYSTPTNNFFRANKIIGGLPVKYGDNQLTEWFKQLPANENIHNNAFELIFKKVLTIKDRCWKYEGEWRMIRMTSGIVSIDKSYLQHVCFGLNTSDNEIKLIQEILEKFNYDVHCSRMQRTEDDFGIRAVKIY